MAKHDDHLPLYRQEAIFERAGLAIPRSTLAAWVGVCGVRLQPLVDAMKAAVPALPDDSFSGLVYYPDVVDSNTVCKVASQPHVPLALTGAANSPQRQQLLSRKTFPPCPPTR